MSRLFSAGLILSLLYTQIPEGRAADNSSGECKSVVVKLAGTRGHPSPDATQRGGPVLTDTIYPVEKTQGGRLQVRHGGAVVWLDKADVVPLGEAVDFFTAAIAHDPRDARAYLCRGAVWHDKEKYDKAIADHNEALRLEPKNVEALRNRGVTWAAKEDYDRALADFNAAIELDARNEVHVHFYRVYVSVARGDDDRAMADANAAIRLDPGFADPYARRGTLWAAKGEMDKSLADYDESIRLNPNQPETFAYRATAWIIKANYDKALADLDEAIRLDARYSYAFQIRGAVWLQNGQYDRALADLNESIRIKLGNGEADLRGAPEKDEGDFRKYVRRPGGEECFGQGEVKDAVLHDSETAGAFFVRSEVLRCKGDCVRALADVETGLRIDAESADGHAVRAWLLANSPNPKRRDGKGAVESARRACELTEWKDADKLDTLAAASAETGDFAAAVKWENAAINRAADKQFTFVPINPGHRRRKIEFTRNPNDKAPTEDYRRRLKFFEAGKSISQSTPVADPGSWQGKMIAIKKAGTKITLTVEGTYPITTVTLTELHYRVLEDRPHRIRIEHLGAVGWLDKDDAVLMDRAADCFSARIDKDPKDARAFAGRGLARSLEKKNDLALQDLTEAVRLQPDCGLWYELRGAIWKDKANQDQAVANFDKAIQLDPQRYSAFCFRGCIEDSKGQYDKAIADLTEAIRLSPRSADAILLRGVAWEHKKDVDRSLADFDEAIRIAPASGFAYFSRAGLRIARGEAELALADYDEAIPLLDDPTPALSTRADLCVKMGKFDQALADCTEIIRLDPKADQMFVVRSIVWYSKGEFDKALADANEAIRIDPKDYTGFQMRGYIFNRKKEFNKALADYSEAVRLEPDNADSYKALARFLSTCIDEKYRDGKRAVELARRGCALSDWKSPELLDVLASACAEVGDFDEAMKWQQKAIDLGKETSGFDVQKAKGRLNIYRIKVPYRE